MRTSQCHHRQSSQSTINKSYKAKAFFPTGFFPWPYPMTVSTLPFFMHSFFVDFFLFLFLSFCVVVSISMTTDLGHLPPSPVQWNYAKCLTSWTISFNLNITGVFYPYSFHALSYSCCSCLRLFTHHIMLNPL